MHSLPMPDLMALGKTFDYWAGESRAVWRSGEGVCQCDAMKWGMSVLQGAVCAFQIVCSFRHCLLLIKTNWQCHLCENCREETSSCS